MIDIDLLAVPNQALSVTLDGARFDLTIKAAGNCVSVDVVRDDDIIVLGQRALGDYPILPYPYMRGNLGNFIFLTDGDEMPEWEKFGRTHFLCYVTAAEIAAMQG